MIIEFCQPARDGEIYAPGCFDSSVGQNVIFNGAPGAAVLKSYAVAEDGKSVRVHLDLPGIDPAVFDVPEESRPGTVPETFRS